MKAVVIITAALVTGCASPIETIYADSQPVHARMDVNADYYHKMIGAYCDTGKARYFNVTEHYMTITCSDFKYISVKIKDF